MAFQKTAINGSNCRPIRLLVVEHQARIRQCFLGMRVLGELKGAEQSNLNPSGGKLLPQLARPELTFRAYYVILPISSCIDTTDKARAAFVQQYLGLKWLEPHLYHAMFKTEMGGV